MTMNDEPSDEQVEITKRMKTLYPMVNEKETPLPLSWSPKDKYSFIGLSHNNLRVFYRGLGKTHKDAASVRATYPIPVACGLYYFEVKIVSKGRDGYIGVGLSTQSVSMNRLPGWDKYSYGYHGDDGFSFCCSGTGQPYGPRFTTGDIVGCGVNLIENHCFYTKNGIYLGVAFSNLPPNLYPTVGLQTPGETVDANFGQAPFVFDLEDMHRQLRKRAQIQIAQFPIDNKQGDWQNTLHTIVQTYLVHHGYWASAEAFSKSTGQTFSEDFWSVKNRRLIQNLVLSGRIGEAIQTVQKIYPRLLEQNPNLHFMLRCRQFVEMINGTDSEILSLMNFCPSKTKLISTHVSSPDLSADNKVIPQSLPPQSPENHLNHTVNHHNNSSTVPVILENNNMNNNSNSNSDSLLSSEIHLINSINNIIDDDFSNSSTANNVFINSIDSERLSNTVLSKGDVEMKNLDILVNSDTNDSSCGEPKLLKSYEMEQDDEDWKMNSQNEMEIDVPNYKRQLCGGNQDVIEKVLQFGKELHSASVQLKQVYGKNEVNKKMIHDAFSLLAYFDPWSSPVGYQLDPSQRKPVCAALNSAILESQNLPKRPPLEVTLAHTLELVKLMTKNGIDTCAFANLNDILES